MTWDDVNSKWVGNIRKLKDPAFRSIYDNKTNKWKQVKWDRTIMADVEVADGFEITQEDIDLLIKNTYYVMLTRPRQKVGIWFKDASTKRHVLEVFGISEK